VNSQLHQLHIMKNHWSTVHVFLLHCEPQSHQLYCAMEVVQQGVIQIFTLQWCCSLKLLSWTKGFYIYS